MSNVSAPAASSSHNQNSNSSPHYSSSHYVSLQPRADFPVFDPNFLSAASYSAPASGARHSGYVPHVEFEQHHDFDEHESDLLGFDDYRLPSQVLQDLLNWRSARAAAVSASSIASLSESAAQRGSLHSDSSQHLLDPENFSLVSMILSQASARNQADNEIDESQSAPSSVLQDLMRCFICFERVRDPHMCPSCSKICCYECISKWLTQRRAQCPHCRAPLTVQTLVNCRFMDDVSRELERIQHEAQQKSEQQAAAVAAVDQAELCSEHPRMHLDYFCKSCQTPLCSDCAMFGAAHRGHEFERLSSVYDSHVSDLRADIQHLESRAQALRDVEAKLQSQIDQVHNAKNSQSEQLSRAVSSIQSRLAESLVDRLAPLLTRQSDVRRETAYLDAVTTELSQRLDPTACPRSMLIARAEELRAMLNVANQQSMVESLLDPANSAFECTDDMFPSEITPPYFTSTFTLSDFHRLRHRFSQPDCTEEIVYSPPVSFNGQQWRLKVYPNGNGASRDICLSVFLELTSEQAQPATAPQRYEYKIELIHPDAAKTVSRSFESQYDIGECWGYNRFIMLDALVEDGFVPSEPATANLNFRFHLRSPSYHALCADQRRYIAHLETLTTQQDIDLRAARSKLRTLSRRLLFSNTNQELEISSNDVNSESEPDLESHIEPAPTAVGSESEPVDEDRTHSQFDAEDYQPSPPALHSDFQSDHRDPLNESHDSVLSDIIAELCADAPPPTASVPAPKLNAWTSPTSSPTSSSSTMRIAVPSSGLELLSRSADHVSETLRQRTSSSTPRSAHTASNAADPTLSALSALALATSSSTSNSNATDTQNLSQFINALVERHLKDSSKSKLPSPITASTSIRSQRSPVAASLPSTPVAASRSKPSIPSAAALPQTGGARAQDASPSARRALQTEEFDYTDAHAAASVGLASANARELHAVLRAARDSLSATRASLARAQQPSDDAS